MNRGPALSGLTMRAGVSPSLGRRLLAMVYEALLICAVLFFAGAVFLAVTGGRPALAPRLLLQVYLLLVAGLYFVFCWSRGGQTLPMKTWKMRIVSGDGSPLRTGRAIARYLCAAATVGVSAAAFAALVTRLEQVFAWLALLPGLVSVGWAAFDRDGRFLHDRLAGPES